MKARKSLTKLSTLVGMAACLAASAASAQDRREDQATTCYVTREAADGSRQQQLCRGGLLTSVQTGRPLLDQDRRPIGCECGGWDATLLGIGALAAIGGGVGAALASGGGSNNQLPIFPIGPSSP